MVNEAYRDARCIVCGGAGNQFHRDPQSSPQTTCLCLTRQVIVALVAGFCLWPWAGVLVAVLTWLVHLLFSF
jgi:hypothetical protein